MRRRSNGRLTTVAAAALVMAATSAAGQPAPAASASAQSQAVKWRAAGGLGWFAQRDVARTGPPVDASPIEWRGHGSSFEVEHERTRGPRLHSYRVSAAVVSDFEYRSELRTVSRPAADRYRIVDGRYEYRRFVFADRVVRGLDFGVGVQAIGSASALARHVPVDLEARESAGCMGAGLVTAARLRRWSPVSLDLEWINGATLARLVERHSERPQTRRTHWGGGWLTDVGIGVDLRVSRHGSLAILYERSDSGLVSNHRSFAASRGSITAGLTYAK